MKFKISKSWIKKILAKGDEGCISAGNPNFFKEMKQNTPKLELWSGKQLAHSLAETAAQVVRLPGNNHTTFNFKPDYIYDAYYLLKAAKFCLTASFENAGDMLQLVSPIIVDKMLDKQVVKQLWENR